MTENTEVRRLVEQALETYDISIDGDIDTTAVGDGYEVKVPFRGEIILETVYSNQGSLLYNKKEGEVSLKGVRDGKLLVTAKLSS
jgi:hypothetical protein